jgi:DNA polymerase-3 subunit epsilon
MEQHRHGPEVRLAVAEGTLNLSALAQRHGIRVVGAHNALADAFITAQVLQRQLRALPDVGVRTLGDLLRIGKP